MDILEQRCSTKFDWQEWRRNLWCLFLHSCTAAIVQHQWISESWKLVPADIRWNAGWKIDQCQSSELHGSLRWLDGCDQIIVWSQSSNLLSLAFESCVAIAGCNSCCLSFCFEWLRCTLIDPFHVFQLSIDCWLIVLYLIYCGEVLLIRVKH